VLIDADNLGQGTAETNGEAWRLPDEQPQLVAFTVCSPRHAVWRPDPRSSGARSPAITDEGRR
jgi:hypothetical protein